MLREAYGIPTGDDELPTVGHAAIPIIQFRDDLSHGGHRYHRWLIAKSNRERIRKFCASSVSEYDRLVPAPTAQDILAPAANAVRP
jgi:hypothetical protein